MTYVEMMQSSNLLDPKVKSFEAIKNSSKHPVFSSQTDVLFFIFNSIAREIPPFLTLDQMDR